MAASADCPRRRSTRRRRRLAPKAPRRRRPPEASRELSPPAVLRRMLYSPPHVPSRPLAVLRRRLLRCRAARTLTAIDTACFLSISQGPLLRVSAVSLRAAGCPTPTRSLPFLELLLRDGRRSSPLRRRRWSRRRRRRSKTRRPQTTDLAALAPTPRCAQSCKTVTSVTCGHGVLGMRPFRTTARISECPHLPWRQWVEILVNQQSGPDETLLSDAQTIKYFCRRKWSSGVSTSGPYLLRVLCTQCTFL